MRRLGVLLLLALTLLGGAAQAAEKRVALVIGNSAYKHIPALDNPRNDARLIARTLGELGFALVGGGPQIDLDRQGFETAVRNFGKQIGGADVALFYYAGHGLQVRGTNWLVPVGANPSSATDLDFEMVDADLVLKQMDGAGTRLNLMILDACRNNPFGGRGLRDAGGGLAQMKAPEGTLISYATQPGNVARDGEDGDSPYSKALAQILRRPGLDIFQLFNTVGLEVKRATGGEQQPWVSNSPIQGQFYFGGPPPAPAAPTPPSPAVPPDVETALWDTVRDSSDPALFRAFLQKFPGGTHAAEAKQRLAAAGTVATAPPAPPSAPRSAPGDFDGVWTGVLSCGPSRIHAAVNYSRLAFTVKDGRVSGTRHGHTTFNVHGSDVPADYEESYDGRIAADGTVSIIGRGHNTQTGDYGIQFGGKVADGMLRAAGPLGGHSCTIAYTRPQDAR